MDNCKLRRHISLFFREFLGYCDTTQLRG